MQITETDLAWLAGIIDGEGSISAQVNKRAEGRICIQPFVAIANTDVGIVESCSRILDGIGVSHSIIRRGAYGGLKSNLPCFTIALNGSKKLAILLPRIIPYLRSVKRVYAERLLQYADMRDAHLFSRDAKGRVRRMQYNAAEIELISSIRTHSKSYSREFMLAASNVVN